MLGDAQAAGAQVAQQQGGEGVVAGHGAGGPAAVEELQQAAQAALVVQRLRQRVQQLQGLQGLQGLKRRRGGSSPPASGPTAGGRPDQGLAVAGAAVAQARIPRDARRTGTEEGDPAVSQRAQVPGGEAPRGAVVRGDAVPRHRRVVGAHEGQGDAPRAQVREDGPGVLREPEVREGQPAGVLGEQALDPRGVEQRLAGGAGEQRDVARRRRRRLEAPVEVKGPLQPDARGDEGQGRGPLAPARGRRGGHHLRPPPAPAAQPPLAHQLLDGARRRDAAHAVRRAEVDLPGDQRPGGPLSGAQARPQGVAQLRPQRRRPARIERFLHGHLCYDMIQGMQRAISRRGLLAPGAASAASAALTVLGGAGCAPGRAAELTAALPASGPPLQVVFMRTANASLAAAYEAQAAAFNKQQQRIVGRFEAAG